jgi:hypothetical protein
MWWTGLWNTGHNKVLKREISKSIHKAAVKRAGVCAGSLFFAVCCKEKSQYGIALINFSFQNIVTQFCRINSFRTVMAK